MKKWILVLVVVLTFMALVGTTSAEVKQGDKEITFSGAYAHLSGSEGLGHMDATILTGSFGYFISDAVEISGKGMGAWIKAGDIELKAFGIGADVKYHWNTTGVTVPYIGAQLNYLHGNIEDDEDDESADGTMYGPMLGVKFFLNDTTILFLEYQYDLFTGDAKDAVNHANMISSGLSFKF